MQVDIFRNAPPYEGRAWIDEGPEVTLEFTEWCDERNLHIFEQNGSILWVTLPSLALAVEFKLRWGDN